MGWTVENPPFVLPPPPNNVAEDGSTCLLLAQTQVLGGQIESCPDLIPQEVRPVFTTLKKKRGCVFFHMWYGHMVAITIHSGPEEDKRCIR